MFGNTIGRILLVVVFLGAGIQHIQEFEGLVREVGQKQIFQQVPIFQQHPELIQGAVGTAIFLQIFGSLLVVLNFKAGYLLLLAFLIPVTAIMHPFWETPNDVAQMVQFLKNLSLAGAMLALFASPSGAAKTAAPSARPASGAGTPNKKKKL